MPYSRRFAENDGARPAPAYASMSYDPNYTRIGFPRPTPAIARLMIVNLVVFVANMLLVGRLSDPAKDGGGLWLALSWSALWEGYGLGVLRLLTYQFTHSFTDPWHLLFNFISMYFFGGIAEQRGLGYTGTIKLYVAGGVFAGLFHMGSYALALGESVPVVGASGSCYALLIYAVCRAPRMEISVLFFNFQLIFLGLLLVGLALYSTFIELARGAGSGVSHGAHFGGAIFGFAVFRFGWFYEMNRDPGSGWLSGLGSRLRRWRDDRATASAEADQQAIDRILDKVHQQGLPSLTPAERRVLDRASQRAKKR